MKTLTTTLAAAVLAVSLTGCGTMNRNTAIGMGLGAATGAVLTNGSTLGTVGGAAMGGAIGSRTR